MSFYSTAADAVAPTGGDRGNRHGGGVFYYSIQFSHWSSFSHVQSVVSSRGRVRDVAASDVWFEVAMTMCLVVKLLIIGQININIA